jgi:hypothetical protein
MKANFSDQSAGRFRKIWISGTCYLNYELDIMNMHTLYNVDRAPSDSLSRQLHKQVWKLLLAFFNSSFW